MANRPGQRLILATRLAMTLLPSIVSSNNSQITIGECERYQPRCRLSPAHVAPCLVLVTPDGRTASGRAHLSYHYGARGWAIPPAPPSPLRLAPAPLRVVAPTGSRSPSSASSDDRTIGCTNRDSCSSGSTSCHTMTRSGTSRDSRSTSSSGTGTMTGRSPSCGPVTLWSATEALKQNNTSNKCEQRRLLRGPFPAPDTTAVRCGVRSAEVLHRAADGSAHHPSPLQCVSQIRRRFVRWVDAARARCSHKRGRGAERVTLDEGLSCHRNMTRLSLP